MSPCCEFLVGDCFYFLSIGRENFFQMLSLGDWGTPKKIATNDNFFLSLVIKNSQWVPIDYARKSKKRRRPDPFLFSSATKLLSLCKCALQEFFTSSFSGGGLLQALQVWLHLRNKSSTRTFFSLDLVKKRKKFYDLFFYFGTFLFSKN